MKAGHFCILAVICLLVGCASQQAIQEKAKGTKPNHQAQPVAVSKGPTSTIRHNITARSAMDTVKTVFREHNLHIESYSSSERTITGVQQKEGGGGLIVVPAKATANGEYLQPVLSLGFGRLVFYATLYTATFEGKQIKITKSEASAESPTRTVVPVELKLLQDIAARIDGEVLP